MNFFLGVCWRSLERKGLVERMPCPAVTTPGDPALEPVAAATDAIWEWVDTHLDAGTRLVPIGPSQGGLWPPSCCVRARTGLPPPSC
jgi:hypothetical protein